MTALAILDDLGAIAIIGVAYTDQISAPWLLAAGGSRCFPGRAQLVWREAAASIVGLSALWLFVLNSGVHATLAGVLLAAATPLGSKDADEGEHSQLHRSKTPFNLM